MKSSPTVARYGLFTTRKRASIKDGYDATAFFIDQTGQTAGTL